MGRAAVACCVVWWLLPAGGYLTGLTGSSTAISDLNDHAVALLWSWLFVSAAVLMLAVRMVRLPAQKNRLELLVLLLFGTGMGVYCVAIYQRTGSLEGRLAISALLGSLLCSLAGRAALLARQLWVAYRARQGKVAV